MARRTGPNPTQGAERAVDWPLVSHFWTGAYGEDGDDNRDLDFRIAAMGTLPAEWAWQEAQDSALRDGWGALPWDA